MYLTNQENYFFDVQCPVDLDKLINYKTFETKQEMYQYVFDSRQLGVESVDELECCELIITKDKQFCCDWAMDIGTIDDVETFINEYIE